MTATGSQAGPIIGRREWAIARTVTDEEIVHAVHVRDRFGPVAESGIYSQGMVCVGAVGLMDLDGNADLHIQSAALPRWPLFVVQVATSLPNNAVVVLDARVGERVAFLAERGYLTDLAGALQGALPGVGVVVSSTLERLVHACHTIVTTTSSRRPRIQGGWLRAGQPITAMGADDRAKAELDGACFARADLLVVDSRSRNQDLGELGQLAREGEVIGGTGRGARWASPRRRTIGRLPAPSGRGSGCRT